MDFVAGGKSSPFAEDIVAGGGESSPFAVDLVAGGGKSSPVAVDIITGGKSSLFAASDIYSLDQKTGQYSRYRLWISKQGTPEITQNVGKVLQE